MGQEVKNLPACQCRIHKRRRSDPWVGKISWRRAWQPTSVFLLENLMDRGGWQAAFHRAAKSQTRLKWLSMHTCKNPNYQEHEPFPQVVSGNIDLREVWDAGKKSCTLTSAGGEQCLQVSQETEPAQCPSSPNELPDHGRQRHRLAPNSSVQPKEESVDC